MSNEPIAVLSCLVRELLLTAPCEFHSLKGILVFVSVSEILKYKRDQTDKILSLHTDRRHVGLQAAGSLDMLGGW